VLGFIDAVSLAAAAAMDAFDSTTPAADYARRVFIIRAFQRAFC
jgi:hypothetical protein